VEVNAVKVSAGDVVARDQPLLEVQADKAALDVPSPVAGRVTEVRVKPGDQIKIGQVYCVIEANGAAAPPAPKPAPAPAAAPGPKPKPAPAPAAAPAPKPEAEPAKAPAPPPPPAAPSDAAVVPAGPATRLLARTLGIDLRQVPGSGKNGRVVEEDVR